MSRDPQGSAENKAWLLFRLDDAPVHTEMGGDFNVPVVMDVVTLLPGVPCRRANSPVCNVSPMVHGSVLLFRSQCL